MAAAPAAISTEVDGQRIMIMVAATNAMATNAELSGASWRASVSSA